MDNERGYIIVTTAMLLVVFLGFGALAIDVGLLYSARTSAQRAADAAALAGAFTFVASPSAPQPSTAYDQAMSTALINNILGTPLTAPEVTVNIDVANERATVEITHTEDTFFARALGRNSVDIAVKAVAETSIDAVATFCAKPWFVPNTVVSELSPCDACAQDQVLVSDGLATTFGESQLGMSFTIKPQNPTGAIAPGQFYAVRMADSAGGNDYRTNIASCSPDVITCQATYGLEPGNMIGPTLQGVNELTGTPPDIYMGIGEYQNSEGNISNTSRSLIIAPLWDICTMVGFCPNGSLPDNGANAQISVSGFALLFLDGVQGNNVVAHLLGVFGCGSISGVPPGAGESGPFEDETGPYSVLVRLVRLP